MSKKKDKNIRPETQELENKAKQDAAPEESVKEEKKSAEEKAKSAENNQNSEEKKSSGSEKKPAEKASKKAAKDGTPVKVNASKRRFSHGLATTLAAVLVIAVAIVVNILVSNQGWSFDMSKQKLYSLSGETRNVLKSIDSKHKVTIYYLDKEGNVNSVYKNILNKFDDASKNVSVKYRDLETYPDFASKYLDSSETADKGDVIVVCGDKSKFITSSDLIGYSSDQSSASINMEPKLLGAINSVTSDSSLKAYYMTGQGEDDLSENFKNSLENDNYELNELDLVQNGGIPKDCSVLIINAPTTDFGDTQISMLEEYLENKGKIYLVLNAAKELPGLNGFVHKFGITVTPGVVIDQGSGYYMGNYPTYLLPTLASHDITSPISKAGMRILMPVCKGMTVSSSDAEKAGYKVTTLVESSDDSFAKRDTSTEGSDSVKMTDEDIAGPLGLMELVEKDDDPLLIVNSSSSMAVDDVDNYTSQANTNLIANAINYLTDQDNMISVKAKTISNEYAMFTGSATKIIMVLGVVGIPVFILVLGFVIWITRRHS